MLPCIILQVGTERLGLLVDALLDEQDVVFKPQSKLLKRVRNVSGATILGTGEVCMILNPQDLLKSARKRTVSVTPQRAVEKVKTKPAILLVEDSITIRTQVKRILDGAGYEVVAAVDGLDGFNKLKIRVFDAVVSDVQMPNLDGLSLTRSSSAGGTPVFLLNIPTYKYFFNNNPNFSFVAAGALSSGVRIAYFSAE